MVLIIDRMSCHSFFRIMCCKAQYGEYAKGHLCEVGGCMNDHDVSVLLEDVAAVLIDRGLMLTTAESCTGGGVAQALTSVSGSSQWFERGFVTYSNRAKEEMLGVPGPLLLQFGAVSEQTVRAMAEGALCHSHAQVSLAISGIAGPGGGTLDKPVGTVWLAWSVLGQETRCHCEHFYGNREQVRQQAVVAALTGILGILADGA
jgi:nicotinamide-nucleotide amidase